jgi:hypothetical protein
MRRVLIFDFTSGLFSFETPLLESHCCVGVFIAVQKGIVEYIIRQLRFFIAAQKGVLEYFIRRYRHIKTSYWSLFWKLLFRVQIVAFSSISTPCVWLVLKGLVLSHSAESFDFSRWGIINIWKNFDLHHKWLWTWSSSSNQHFRNK